MRTIVPLLISILFFLVACEEKEAAPGSSSDTSTARSADTMVYGDMKQYWLVFLKKGPNRNQDSVARAMIQEKHLANIDRLAKEKIIIMAGPMGYSTPNDLQGIFIMDAKDSATAASYVQTDTAVVTGRLKFEIHPWWTAKGKYEFK